MALNGLRCTRPGKKKRNCELWHQTVRNWGRQPLCIICCTRDWWGWLWDWCVQVPSLQCHRSPSLRSSTVGVNSPLWPGWHTHDATPASNYAKHKMTSLHSRRTVYNYNRWLAKQTQNATASSCPVHQCRPATNGPRKAGLWLQATLPGWVFSCWNVEYFMEGWIFQTSVSIKSHNPKNTNTQPQHVFLVG